ncbi:MAG: MBOAT family O-acyltransferase [Succinivibrionaceae bacterium]
MRNFVLLTASLIFYAWGEPKYLAIMLGTIVICYLFGNIIGIIKNKTTKLIMLTCSLLCNLGVLCYFKYFNFLCENINQLFHTNYDFIKVVMPIGISFYTFQAISYLIDVYRGDTKPQKDIYKLALFISLFPQLIAGPIVKYHDINTQIDERHIEFKNVVYGVKRFIIGLSKKMLIANTAGEIADKIFSQNADGFSPTVAWIGAIAYSIQIFFDFSGYSDMAIGLGAIFGFKFKENFNYPYISKTITEFWRRWHISLSTWFKEYLYIPLGGNKKGEKKTYCNLFIVFLATGVWHGAAWNFVIWGLWNGLFVIIERFFGLNKDTPRSLLKNILLHFYCILIFIFGWVLFRSPDLNYALTYIQNMLGLISHEKDVYKLIYYIDVLPILTFIIALMCCTPIFKNFLIKTEQNKVLLWLSNVWIYILLLLSAMTIATSTYNPFIYFRF